MVRPYILNLCGRRGNELYISTDNLSYALKAVAPSFIETAREKVAFYFENLHLTVPAAVKMNIILYSQVRVRQAQILMPLYYATAMTDELYRWATFIGGDIVITDKQRSDYWKMLFKAGYNMRSAPDPDYPPDYKYNPDSCEKSDMSKSSKKDLLDMYQRWAAVTGSLNRAEDSLWLSVSSQTYISVWHTMPQTNLLRHMRV